MSAKLGYIPRALFGRMVSVFSPHFPMHVEHFEKGVSYTDKDLLMLAKKIGRLATYCRRLKDEGSKIRVESESRNTKKEDDHVKVMLTVYLPKKTLRAESRKPHPLDALERCIEKLEPQIKKYKEMHTGKGRMQKFKSNKRAS